MFFNRHISDFISSCGYIFFSEFPFYDFRGSEFVGLTFKLFSFWTNPISCHIVLFFCLLIIYVFRMQYLKIFNKRAKTGSFIVLILLEIFVHFYIISFIMTTWWTSHWRLFSFPYVSTFCTNSIYFFISIEN